MHILYPYGVTPPYKLFSQIKNLIPTFCQIEVGDSEYENHNSKFLKIGGGVTKILSKFRVLFYWSINPYFRPKFFFLYTKIIIKALSTIYLKHVLYFLE